MSQEILYMKINGVEVPYWSPTFCEEGADGLVGADERILTLPYQTVGGVQVDYWSADTCGDKYSYDFGGGSPSLPTSGLVGYYTPFDVSYLGFSSANNVNLVVDQAQVTYGSEQVTNGDFSNDTTGWGPYSSGALSVTGGVAKVEATTNAMIRQNGAFNSIKNQLVKFRARCTKLENIAYNNGTSIIQTSLTFDAVNEWQDFELFIDDMLNTNLLLGVYTGLTTGDYIEFEYISSKEILTGTNDLTQGTASANMTLEEHDTVTQFTSANQPTLKYDAEVSQDTSANQPTLVDTGGGELAMEFDGTNKYLESDKVLTSTGDWSIQFTYSARRAQGAFLSSSTTSARFYQLTGSNTIIYLLDDNSNLISFDEVELEDNQKFKLVKNSNNISLLVNDVLITTEDATGNTYTFDTIGRASVSADVDLMSLKQWNSADSSGDPDFTLDASDQSSIRTSANEIAQDGENVAKWYAQEHNPYQNTVVFDGTNDNISGMPAQANDFTYVWEVEHSALSTTDYIFSSSGTPSALLLLSDNYYYLRDTTGAGDIGLTFHAVEAGLHTYALVRSGDNVSLYVDSVFKQTVDVTGRTYTWDTVGDSADSLGGGLKRINVYDRALTQDEINWFSYLRDENGNILQPPLLPS